VRSIRHAREKRSQRSTGNEDKGADETEATNVYGDLGLSRRHVRPSGSVGIRARGDREVGQIADLATRRSGCYEQVKKIYVG
jgi:hypothetical protein